MKMANMANNRQSLNKNSNDMSKEPIEIGDFDDYADVRENGKICIKRAPWNLTKTAKMTNLAKIRQSCGGTSNEKLKGAPSIVAIFMKMVNMAMRQKWRIRHFR